MSPAQAALAGQDEDAEAAEAQAGLDVILDADAWQGADGMAEGAFLAALEEGGAVGAEALRAGARAALLLSGDDELARLNERFRGRSGATDILSFPAGAEAFPQLGDMAVALETAERDAALVGWGLAEHLAHLVVHGTLHLLGWEHEGEAEAAAMQAREAKALARLGLPDPYRGGPT